MAFIPNARIVVPGSHDTADVVGIGDYPSAGSGTFLAIGDPHYNSNVGQVTVYRAVTGDQWVAERTISSPSVATTRFGSSLSYHSGTLIVGAPYDSTGASNAGIVYVYTSDGASLQASLVPGDPQTNCYVGLKDSIYVANDYIVAASPNHNKTLSQDGCIHYWTRTGTSWTEQSEIASPSPLDNGHFATYLGFDGYRIAASKYDSTDTLYVLSSSLPASLTWTTEQTIQIANFNIRNIAINNSTLFVNTVQTPTAGEPYTVTRIFDRNSSNVWSERFDLSQYRCLDNISDIFFFDQNAAQATAPVGPKYGSATLIATSMFQATGTKYVYGVATQIATSLMYVKGWAPTHGEATFSATSQLSAIGTKISPTGACDFFCRWQKHRRSRRRRGYTYLD